MPKSLAKVILCRQSQIGVFGGTVRKRYKDFKLSPQPLSFWRLNYFISYPPAPQTDNVSKYFTRSKLEFEAFVLFSISVSALDKKRGGWSTKRDIAVHRMDRPLPAAISGS